MNRIDEIINELTSVLENPHKVIADHRKLTGKGAVGIMPVYSPEEIVYASGFLPMGIWGGQKTISKARTYLPPFACSVMQSVMEMQLEGEYDDLEAVIFSVPCDTLKCMSQKWKGSSPVIVFTHPQNRKISAANEFLCEEFNIVRNNLENLLNVTITDESINRSIEIYNDNRKAMREFSDLAAIYPNLISPAKRHIVMKSRLMMDKAKHTVLVKELMDKIKKKPVKHWDGIKVVLTGITAEPGDLLEILSENRIAVVADDLAQESRQFRNDIPEGDSPISRLAKWWQDFDGCSLAVNTKKPRGQMLIDMVERYKADAVLVCMMKFCDPEEFDYPIYYSQLQEAGIKNLYLEIDQESTSFEQVRTRVQSLCETIQNQWDI